MSKHNIDLAEINKFERIAERWWDLNGECKPLHEINPLRLQYICHRSELAGKKVLDVGCGGGILAESMAKLGADVTGIDMSESAIKAAQLHAKIETIAIDYQQCTVETLVEQQADAYDIITCMELLEHVPDPLSVIKACSALVKPNGLVFFSTLNRNIKAYLFAIVGAEYLLNMLPQGTHDYAKFIQPAELASWARQAGLTVDNFKGLTYNPLTKHYRLTDDISVNYLVQCRRGE